ncbi:DUF4453 domain-containing protein [Tateyamaria sp. SN6-1]|uniref:DUF4453 domain-containing protein n=1 Tax=Tateyamaria sp. SN6-1 TaxID=3092148 RepID=UPI0039F4F2F0
MRLTLILCLLTGPALADACDDWWFTRNLIIDRAGYCFGSALGQAQFDNTGCTGKDVTLSAADTAAVAKIRTYEAEYQCRVDTSQTQLYLPDRAIRLQLDTQPISDALESACINYRAAPLTLRSGPGPQARPVGQITQGDTISFGHEGIGDWAYVTTYDGNGILRSGGWLGDRLPEASCEFWAG